jgi:hypothetical protein
MARSTPTGGLRKVEKGARANNQTIIVATMLRKTWSLQDNHVPQVRGADLSRLTSQERFELLYLGGSAPGGLTIQQSV